MKKHIDWREIKEWIQIFLVMILTFRGILGIYAQVFSALGLTEPWALVTLVVMSIASTFGLFYWIVRSNRI